MSSTTRNNAKAGPALGLVVALLGLTTTSGWLLQVPLMVQLREGLLPMVFNTGLCFLLCGTALVLGLWQDRRAIALRAVIAIVLILLCGLTLVEHVLDRSLLGIDLPGLHAWYDYGNTRPGRMAPNTALGFIVAGCALIVDGRVTRRSLAVTELLLTFLLMAIGLTGLVGYLLSPDLLFNWAKSARMALHTATGMILIALALWLSWSRSDWYVGEAFFREDVKVRMLSASILVLVATTTALTGFVFQQATAKSTMEDRLTTIVKARGPWLQLLAREVGRQAEQAIELTGVDAAAARLQVISPTTQAEAQRLGERFSRHGWERVVLQAPGTALALLGPAQSRPVFEAPLDPQGRVDLVWDGRLILRVRHPLAGGDGMQLVLERGVPELAAVLFANGGLGETGEVLTCAARGSDMLCLPTRLRPQAFFVPMRPPGKDPLPMQLALAGERGVKQAQDYRQKTVIAAYGQLAPGIGFIAKQDAVEIYAPIRSALAIGAPLLLLLSAVGAGLMVWQLGPLVARMRSAEAVASSAAAKMSRLAQYDALTGLPNRSLFMDRLATAALRAGRAQRPLAVLFLDLDGFKAINDGFGHREGDAVLVETARRLGQAVRKSDTVARLGGDEFTIILEQLSQPLADVQAVADKIIHAMREPFIVQGQPQQVTVSVGAALHPEGGAEPSITALLNRADTAMYEAKRAGKNALRISAPA